MLQNCLGGCSMSDVAESETYDFCLEFNYSESSLSVNTNLFLVSNDQSNRCTYSVIKRDVTNSFSRARDVTCISHRVKVLQMNTPSSFGNTSSLRFSGSIVSRHVPMVVSLRHCSKKNFNARRRRRLLTETNPLLHLI